MPLSTDIAQVAADLASASTSILHQVQNVLKSNNDLSKQQRQVMDSLSKMSESMTAALLRNLPGNRKEFSRWESVANDLITELNTVLSDINHIDVRDLSESIRNNSEKLNDLQIRLTEKRATTVNYPKEISQHREQIRHHQAIVNRLTRPGVTSTPARRTQLATARAVIASETRSAKNKQAELNYVKQLELTSSKLASVNSQLKSLATALRMSQEQTMDSLIPGTSKVVNSIKQFNENMNSTAPTWAKVYSVVNTVITGLVKMGSALGELAQQLYAFGREYATPLEQAGAAVWTSVTESFKSLFQEASFSNKQYLETVKATQNVIGGQFGREETSRLTGQALELGVSPEEMIGATYAAYGTMGRSYADAEKSAMGVKATFDKVGLTGRKAFDYMKQNAFLLAVYGKDFVGSIGESAARFAKMGLDMQVFKNLSDNIVMDFGSFIDKTAELGATIPGLQLDVATLSQKAFIEGPVAVADELQKQLGAVGKNFADLPYFQQVSLRQALSLDETAIAKLMGKEELQDIPTQSLEEQKTTNTKLDNLANKLGLFLSRFGALTTITPILTSILGVVGSIATYMAANAVLKGTTGTGVLGTIGKSTIGRGVLAVGKGLGFGAAGYLGGAAMDSWGESLAEKGNKKGAAQAHVGGAMLKGAGYGAAIGSIIPVVGTATGAALGAGLMGAYSLYQNRKDLWGNKDTAPVRPAESRVGNISNILQSNPNIAPAVAGSTLPMPSMVQRIEGKDPFRGRGAGGSFAPTPNMFEGVVERVSPPSRVPINPYTGKPTTTTVDTTGTVKPFTVGAAATKSNQEVAQVDFSPMLKELKELGNKIGRMKMEGIVTMDGHKLGIVLGQATVGATPHMG